LSVILVSLFAAMAVSTSVSALFGLRQRCWRVLVAELSEEFVVDFFKNWVEPRT